jgi:hypothetical protein
MRFTCLSSAFFLAAMLVGCGSQHSKRDGGMPAEVSPPDAGTSTQTPHRNPIGLAPEAPVVVPVKPADPGSGQANSGSAGIGITPAGSGGMSGSAGGGSDSMSTSGPDAGARPTGPAHVVKCRGFDIAGPQCTCESNDRNMGEVQYDGPDCLANSSVSSDTELSEFCCADTNYPNSGSCSCYYDNSQWLCTAADPQATYCKCGFASSMQASDPDSHMTSTCGDTAGGNGASWLCYSMDGVCSCEQGIKSVPAGAILANTCTYPPAQFKTPISACPSGTTQIDQCRSGGRCKADYECPQEIPLYGGKSGGCKNTCNTDTGECYCLEHQL